MHAIQWETQPSELRPRAGTAPDSKAFHAGMSRCPPTPASGHLCLGRNPAYFSCGNTTAGLRGWRDRFWCSTDAKRSGLPEQGIHAAIAENSCFILQNRCSFDLEHRPGCLRLEVGTCVGPCAAACTRSQYDRQVNVPRVFWMVIMSRCWQCDGKCGRKSAV